MSDSLPPLPALIHQLLSRPSVSSGDPNLDLSNAGVIELLAAWLEELGFRIAVQEVVKGKFNLLAKLGGDGAQGEGLVLSGHTDTVPFDEGLWQHNPFGGGEQDGRWYGLGSCDMKSFFALAIEAVRGMDARALRKPLTILATADEESTMSGAKYLASQGLKLGRYAVIGEPTNLMPIRMHKGVMMESIQVIGHSGHSSDPSLGANAIEGMHRVLTELLAWRGELQARHRNPCFKVDVPTMNFGAIRGGDNPNRICPRCEMLIDIRPLPGMDIMTLRHAMQDRLAKVFADYPKLQVTVQPLFDGVPPFESPKDSALVRACEALSGAESGAVAFGTEAPYLSGLGMETVVLGAGHIEQAHQPDEYLPMAHVKPMVAILQGLIGRFCMGNA